MILNITNGECFNNYIKKKSEGLYVPFNEAMITGHTTLNIFDDEFINDRSAFHNITKEEYIKKLNNIHDQNFVKSFTEIILWFGHDTFCQINLLTLLAYFNQINYPGNVYLIIIDDYTNEIIKQKEQISFINMKHIYNTVITKKKYIETNNDLLNNAIKSYLDFTFGKDETSTYIKNNLKQDHDTLLKNCLSLSVKQGLSDIIISQLINDYTNSIFYQLYYRNQLIGNLVINQYDYKTIYTPIRDGILKLDTNNLLHNFLKEDFIGTLEEFPFFKQRLRDMEKFKLNEIQYQNDFYLLKQVIY